MRQYTIASAAVKQPKARSPAAENKAEVINLNPTPLPTIIPSTRRAAIPAFLLCTGTNPGNYSQIGLELVIASNLQGVHLSRKSRNLELLTLATRENIELFLCLDTNSDPSATMRRESPACNTMSPIALL